MSRRPRVRRTPFDFDDTEDLAALRAEIEAELDPAWVARYGEASWRAALVVFGMADPQTGELLGHAEVDGPPTPLRAEDG